MRRCYRIKLTFSEVSRIRSGSVMELSPTSIQHIGDLNASHTIPHMLPSIYSLDNCCCKRIPLRAHALPNYPYDPERMLTACPLTPVWSSMTDHLSMGGKMYSWSACSNSLLETLPKVHRKPRVSIRHYRYWYSM